jgi:exonuclease SbcC
MQGFMRYRDTTPAKVTFPEKFTAVTGPTGSGKSSILDAITFALYGKSSRTDEQLKVEEFVDKNGYVRLEFFQGGQRFEVVRGRKGGRSYLTLNQNLRRVGGRTTEIQQEIVNVVGLDYVGFRNSTFIRQDEMKAIGSETGAVRLDIFQRLFRLEVFEKAQKIAEQRLKEAREASVKAEAEMKQKRELYEEALPEKRNEQQAAKEHARTLKKGADELGRKEATLRGQIQKAQPLHELYVRVSETITTLNAEIAEDEKRVEEAERKDEQRRELARDIERLRKAADEHSQLAQEETRLREKQEKVRAIDEKTRIHRSNITRINDSFREQAGRVRKRLGEYEKRLKSLKASLGKDEAFDLLRLEGALGERLHRIDKELDWLSGHHQMMELLKDERLKAQKQLPEVSKKTRSITGDIFLKTEIESSIKRADEDLAKARDKATEDLRKEKAAIAGFERQKRSLGFTPGMEKRLGEARERLRLIKSDAAAYPRQRDRLGRLSDQRALIRSLKRDASRKKQDLKKLLGQEEKLRPREQQYSDLSKQFDETHQKVSKAAEEAGTARGRYEGLEKEVEELEKLKPKIDELRKKTEKLAAEEELYTILKEEIFHRKGVLIFAINQLLQGIARESSYILGELTDKRLNNIRLTPYTDTRGGGVRIDVEGVDGLFHDVSVFSGGEKTQVNAALRLAIAKELASMPQVGKSYGNMKTLFIDEGDLGSLDTEQSRKLFIRKLFTLGDLFERVILITQLTDVAEQFPSRIRVYMTPEQFSRVEAPHSG